MIIHDVICNGCNEHYIEGEYFKCSICNDYKLCEDCMAKNIRIPPCDLGHEMNLQDYRFDDWQNAMKIGKFKQGSQYSLIHIFISFTLMILNFQLEKTTAIILVQPYLMLVNMEVLQMLFRDKEEMVGLSKDHLGK